MSPPKRPKLDKKAKKKAFFTHQNRKNKYLEAGQRGFLVTCNFREKDSLREAYRILNDYADELYGKQENDAENADEKQTDDEEEIDISVQLQKETESAQAEVNKKAYRFQSVDTGTSNCLFIKTELESPKEIGMKIVNDLAETKQRKSRYILRFLPIDIVCRANVKDIMDAAGKFFDQYFLKEGKTFSIIFNKRYNNDLNRDEVIKELAGMIATKNIKNKVDLKNAEISVVVEVIKGLCCLSVVPDYLKLKKFNLAELGSAQNKEPTSEEKEVLKVDEEPTDTA